MVVGADGCSGGSQVPLPTVDSELTWFERFSPVEEGQGIVIIYRPGAFFAALAMPWVSLNGYKTVLLGNDQYTRVVMQPGNHSINTELSDHWVSGRPHTLYFTVEKGEIVFLEVSHSWYFVKGVTDFFLGIFCPACVVPDGFKIEKVARSTALNELKKGNFISSL